MKKLSVPKHQLITLDLLRSRCSKTINNFLKKSFPHIADSIHTDNQIDMVSHEVISMDVIKSRLRNSVGSNFEPQMISICNSFIDNADQECFNYSRLFTRYNDNRNVMLNYVSYELLKLDLVALSKKESVS
jgi:hypothetical protein